MIEVKVSGEIEASAATLWGLLRDFGSIGWMPPVTRSETEGEGVGMVRLIYAGDGPPVREQLEARDDAQRQLGYGIPEGNPLPVDDYHATVQVGELGPKRSSIEWVGRFSARGVSDAEAEATVKGMYGVLISWVKAAAESMPAEDALDPPSRA